MFENIRFIFNLLQNLFLLEPIKSVPMQILRWNNAWYTSKAYFDPLGWIWFNVLTYAPELVFYPLGHAKFDSFIPRPKFTRHIRQFGKWIKLSQKNIFQLFGGSKKTPSYLYMMRMNIFNPFELFKTRLLKNSQFFKILKSRIDVKRKTEHVYKVSVIHKHNFNV